jgi:hypothetical protein
MVSRRVTSTFIRDPVRVNKIMVFFEAKFGRKGPLTA